MSNLQSVKPQTQPTIAELQARIAQLEAEQALASNDKLTLKVSEKGAVSVYGLMRFPVTLYRKAWDRLLQDAENIKAFIKANESKLSTGKDDVRFKQAEKAPQTGAVPQQPASSATMPTGNSPQAAATNQAA